MSLTINNQLQLLHDLLSLHAEENCGSSSECEQITRLINSIQNDPYIQQTGLVNHLNVIKQYGDHGATSINLDEHITNYQPEIKEWLQVIKDSNH